MKCHNKKYVRRNKKGIINSPSTEMCAYNNTHYITHEYYIVDTLIESGHTCIMYQCRKFINIYGMLNGLFPI